MIAAMLVVAVCCAALALALGLAVAGGTGPTGPDSAVASALSDALAGQDALLGLLVLPSEAVVLVPVTVLTAALCLATRRGRVLPLVAVPWLVVAVNGAALKPAFGRMYEAHLAYPSGHTVSLVGVLTVLAVLARPGVARAVVVVAAVLLTASAGAGMVVLGYHYATDVAGGALVAVAAVLAAEGLLGVSGEPRRRRRAPARSAC